MRRSLLKIALPLVVAASAACSLLYTSSADQCSTDGDCARFPAYPVCSQGVCVARGAQQDGQVTTDAPVSDVDNGCPPVPPDAEIDFLNACTNAQCIDFDNCARLNLCGDAALPALVAPPDAAPPPPDASDGGPDVNDSGTD
jgi:hypothetical protein